MRKYILVTAVGGLLSSAVAAEGAGQNAYNFANNWPTHHVFEDGTDFGISLKYQYDVNRFSNDDGRFEDAQTNRRKELGFYLKKKGVYEAVVAYDFQAKAWLDTNVRFQGKHFTRHDIGALRVGFSKTPLGFEGNTSTGATTFLETALPTQAIYAGRRLGVDWTFEHPGYVLDAGYYWGGDLNGGSDGRMLATRAAWVPFVEPGHVLHLGLAASRELPEGSTDGRGLYSQPAARLRARPEAALLSQRLVDSGNLLDADHIDRHGIEALWINGAWSLQGEILKARVTFANQTPSYEAQGYYVFASWIVTGESRSYSGGNVGNVKPKGAFGAVELALRYSHLDLDDSPVLGGSERNWTLGANWTINRYLKLQANYVWAWSDRRGEQIDPRIAEVRAQVQF